MWKTHKNSKKCPKNAAKILIIPIFFLFGALAYAQTRDDIHIYIPMPIGGTSEQQMYFHENFIMETMAASYAVTESADEADYTLNLHIKQNMILFDDGTEEPAPPDEDQYVITLLLVRTEDNVDIVQFDFPFTELPEMYEFNLFLIYQAMANVPLTKLVGGIEDDHWRNKWLYLRASLDFNIPVFTPDKDHYYMAHDAGIPIKTPLHHLMPIGPGLTVGLELYFLNWMAVELDLALVFGNVNSVPGIGIAFNRDPVGTFDVVLKFPIKPASHYMIEPFAGAAFPVALIGTNLPSLGIVGGIQIGIKAGSMGAFIVNVRGEYDLGKAHVLEPGTGSTESINWSRFVLGVGVGYKIGFVNRNN